MGLWLSILALSLGIAVIIALSAGRASRTGRAVAHDRAPPLGRPKRPIDRSAEPTLRRFR